MNGLSVERIEVLLCVAVVVALLARKARLPYTVGLVAAGAGLAAFGVLDGFTLTKDLIFKALLPPLIFEAAFFIRWKELRENLGPVLTLATAGIILTAALVAAVMSIAGGWWLPSAIVFGALIAATDPVSVIAMFKELKVEGRLRLLVESESLINDGVAAVAFSLALLLAAGTQPGPGTVLTAFLQQAGGGIACGALVAGAVLYLAGKTDEHLVELTFTAVAAFGSFLVAEHFGCSGVLAVLVAGLMIGNLGHIGGIGDQSRDTVGAFWEFAAFVSNSIIFLLIGMREFSLGRTLLAEVPIIALAILASTAGRALTVYGLSLLFRKGDGKISTPDQHVLFWGGLKGALSLALVLGLPEDLPAREQLIAAAFGVVAFSVVIQGLTMPALMRRLRPAV